MKNIVRLAGTLLGISVAVALLLGVVNSITEPIILRMQAEKTAAAMAQVLKADEYERIDGTYEGVTALYRAVLGGKQIGYVAEVYGGGFNGKVNMVVGIDMDGKVTGVSVTQHTETKGVGTKVTDDPNVLGRFTGMSGEITVNTGENRFDGVTGATVSSRAVTAGVNAALAAAAAAQKGGNA